MKSILAGVDWSGVFKTIGSAGVTVAILGFIAQNTFKHVLDLNVENHKAELKRQVDEALLAQKVALSGVVNRL